MSDKKLPTRERDRPVERRTVTAASSVAALHSLFERPRPRPRPVQRVEERLDIGAQGRAECMDRSHNVASSLFERPRPRPVGRVVERVDAGVQEPADEGVDRDSTAETGAGGDPPPLPPTPSVFVPLSYTQVIALSQAERVEYDEALCDYLDRNFDDAYVLDDAAFAEVPNPNQRTIHVVDYPDCELFFTDEERRKRRQDAASKTAEERALLKESLKDLKKHGKKVSKPSGLSNEAKAKAAAALAAELVAARTAAAAAAAAARAAEAGVSVVSEEDELMRISTQEEMDNAATHLEQFSEADMGINFDSFFQQEDRGLEAIDGYTVYARAFHNGRSGLYPPAPDSDPDVVLGRYLTDWHEFNAIPGKTVNETINVIEKKLCDPAMLIISDIPGVFLPVPVLPDFTPEILSVDFNAMTTVNQNSKIDSSNILREVLRFTQVMRTTEARLRINVRNIDFCCIRHSLDMMTGIRPLHASTMTWGSNNFRSLESVLRAEEVEIIGDGRASDAGGPRKKYVANLVKQILARNVENGLLISVGSDGWIAFNPNWYQFYAYNPCLLEEDLKLLFISIALSLKVLGTVPLNLHPTLQSLLMSGTILKYKEVFSHMSQGLFQMYFGSLFEQIVAAVSVEENKQETLDILCLASQMNKDDMGTPVFTFDEYDGTLTKLKVGEVFEYITKLNQALLRKIYVLVLSVSTILNKFDVSFSKLIRSARDTLMHTQAPMQNIYRQEMYAHLQMRQFFTEVRNAYKIFGNLTQIEHRATGVHDEFIKLLFSAEPDIREFKFVGEHFMRHHFESRQYIDYLNEFVAAVYNSNDVIERMDGRFDAFDETYSDCPYNGIFDSPDGSRKINCPYCCRMKQVRLVDVVAMFFGSSVQRPGTPLHVRCRTQSPFTKTSLDLTMPFISIHTCAGSADFLGCGHAADAPTELVRRLVWHEMCVLMLRNSINDDMQDL